MEEVGSGHLEGLMSVVLKVNLMVLLGFGLEKLEEEKILAKC